MTVSSLNKYRIILASKSPRRQELLKDLGFRFDVEVLDWNEDYPSGLKGNEIAMYLARRKADHFRMRIRGNEIVITADTIVWCDDELLDKPDTREDARQILRKISGNTHEVITGVFLLSVEKEACFSSSTLVTFSALTDEEIDYYIDNFRPYDKAGAYGIQEWIGIAACSRIEGSYFNVMGLPSEQLYHELLKFAE
ncbi:MAG: Maf family nucleotide pyrophosphatase [Bacteroidales bacterium]|jgi:septum formation protein|nr:Maf family nucleotide pyrophosphatase [Bacteroidales bacterium]